MSLRSSNLLPHFEKVSLSRNAAIYAAKRIFRRRGHQGKKVFLFLLAIFTKFGYDMCVIGYTGGEQHANN